ncbi:WD40 repeat-like protein [Melanomma pulvis-pyrius CBS 109.77]|uniref:WD40 repeat-like protein n=1 Tax=Melanomma pulvis-pyrius CBS 109.77 TaxID=1314802 RepID=A0A6A6WUR7_9PLEO|nr:WD40 repeat-like protein [Melanomma pulvis-pyrius CBS 109.77]
MADIAESPLLKRKREGKEPQRKRNKTDRKSKAGLGESDGDGQLGTGKEVEATDIPTPKSAPAINGETEATSNAANGSVEREQKPSKKRGKKRNKNLGKKEQSQEADNIAQNSEEPHQALEAGLPPTEPTVNGNIEHTRSALLPKKKKRRQSNKEEGGNDVQSLGDNQDVDTPKESKSALQNTQVSVKVEPTSPSSSRKPHKTKHTSKKSPWSVSAPFGGWFLPQDPAFSSDEKFLILANTRALQIYSTETSLLANTLPVGSGVLTAYALSATNPSQVYIANSAGLITLWDWIGVKKIGRWDIGTNIRQIAVVTQPETTQDLVYCHEVGSSHVINVHALRTRDQKSQTDLKRIFKSKSPISNIEVLLGGNVVVVACATSVVIGRRSKLQKTTLQDFEYIWREFTTSKRITTLCSNIQRQQLVGEGKRSSKNVQDNLDIAVGDESGVIHLFEDILSVAAGLEKSQKKREGLTADLESLKPKRLHWHRDAVGSVKWSLDGNYVISGGDETVLVIWQLSTGQQQHLPHLTAAIENIVVSPSGASYAISLANNSVIVLSTTELEAKTNIIGVQSRRVDLDQLPRDSESSFYSFDIFGQVPMAVDPKNKHQLIFSMPSSQPRCQQKRVHPEPYVQTFDFATQSPVSRQALTRNNATDPNMGPEGRRIQEPSIKFLQISSDGNWLATVDEWSPPRADMGYLEEGIPEFNQEERSFRHETYLKFWEWNEKNAQWALQSRLDAPHFFEDVGAVAQVFDLIPDPAGLGFATVGEDRFVRIWRPKTRLQNGVFVRGTSNSKTGVVTWSLDRSIELSSKLDVFDTNSDPTNVLAPRTSRLAFSADGSVLAAGVSWTSDADPGVIQIIDTMTGAVRRSITELDVTALSCLGIIGRHLIAIGDSITVWDMVLDQLVYCVPFHFTEIDQMDTSALVRLAINDNDGTFAVACPQFETDALSKSRGTRYFKKATSKVSIFDPCLSGAVWSTTVPEVVLSLVSARDGKGYIALDSSSSIRLISPRASALQLITPPPETVVPHYTDRTNGGQDDGMESDESEMRNIGSTLETLTGSEDLLQNSENDKPVVRTEQLQAIFETKPSHALPPVKDLFNAVVGLYARKPRVSHDVSLG